MKNPFKLAIMAVLLGFWVIPTSTVLAQPLGQGWDFTSGYSGRGLNSIYWNNPWYKNSGGGAYYSYNGANTSVQLTWDGKAMDGGVQKGTWSYTLSSPTNGTMTFVGLPGYTSLNGSATFKSVGTNLFNYVPPTWTVTESIYLDNSLYSNKVTTISNNTTYTLTQPTTSTAIFNYWKLNSVNQASSLPYNLLVTTNNTVGYYFTSKKQFIYNVFNPQSNPTASLSVWTSLQGSILLGQSIPSGTSYGGNIYVSPGERVRVVVDGAVLYDYTYPIELPTTQSFSYNIPAIVQPSPTPTPTPTPISAQPTPTPTPIPNPTSVPTPPPSSGSSATPTLPPTPTLAPVTTNLITNPFIGSTNTSLTKEDFYDTIKKAILDSQNETSPVEQTLTDTSSLQSTLNTNASSLTNSLSNTVNKVNSIGTSFQTLSTNLVNLANSFQPKFPSLGTTVSVPISLPVLGSFTLNISNLPGLSIFRAITTFFLWLLAIIFLIHIIRKAIA